MICVGDPSHRKLLPNGCVLIPTEGASFIQRIFLQSSNQRRHARDTLTTAYAFCSAPPCQRGDDCSEHLVRRRCLEWTQRGQREDSPWPITALQMPPCPPRHRSLDPQRQQPRDGPTTASQKVALPRIPAGVDCVYAAAAEAAKNKMCKNVTIYGYCRYEGKGCAFRHDRVLHLLPFLRILIDFVAETGICEAAAAKVWAL